MHILTNMHSVLIKRMARHTLFILFTLALVFPGKAQHRLLDQVKHDLASQSLTADSYINALKKLRPALEHEETRDKADTWFWAGKINFMLHDKLMGDREIGKTVKDSDLGDALLNGYSHFAHALSLDSVAVKNKRGEPVIDKKTGRQKIKTKYSREINSLIVDRLNAFRNCGGEFFVAKQWDKAAESWSVYCRYARSATAHAKRKAPADSVVGYYRYFQGLALAQAGHHSEAVAAFTQASEAGYNTKHLFDAWLDVLLKLDDREALVRVAGKAFTRHGNKDSRYINIIINNYLAGKKWDSANELLDRALELTPDNEQYIDLKGQIAEQNASLDDAIAFYRRSIEINPQYAPAQFNLGNALYSKAVLLHDASSAQAAALYREALPHVERAYELGLKDDKVRNVLSRLYYVTDSAKLDDILP